MAIQRLSGDQQAFFDTFGFLHFPGLLTDRIGRITEEFEDIWARNGGGHNGQPHDGTARSCIVPFLDQSEYLSSLLDDPRLLSIFATFLGDDFNYMGSDGNYYVGDTGWHPDGNHVGITHMKVAFYLDPLTRDTGALRAIPGSHRLDDSYAKSAREAIQGGEYVYGVHRSEIPCAALETQPGDVVCFNHNTLHASFGGSIRRRMFTMNCAQRYPDDRLDEFRSYISGAARFWIDHTYGEPMLRTAGPERMVHLEQMLANDGHLAELARERREEMSEPSRG